MRAAPFATEADCGEAAGARSEFANAFNNLCLHTFSPPLLPPPEDPSWARPFEAPPADDPLVQRDVIPAGCCAWRRCVIYTLRTRIGVCRCR